MKVTGSGNHPNSRGNRKGTGAVNPVKKAFYFTIEKSREAELKAAIKEVRKRFKAKRPSE